MDYKIFKEYIGSIKNPSAEGFYNWVKWNYPDIVKKLNLEIIKKYF